ncbi:hypothetical protein AA313_de0210216 [Arthrobotrys entomopaga]|nr:hypothetical protein AA313_de0210216 [Arthrobotrys entomopaga]
MKFTVSAVLFALALGVQAAPNPVPNPAPNPTATIEPAPCPVYSCGIHTVTIRPPVPCPAIACPAYACPALARVTQVPCCCKTAQLITTTVTAPCCPTCHIPTATMYVCPIIATAEPTVRLN